MSMAKLALVAAGLVVLLVVALVTQRGAVAEGDPEPGVAGNERLTGLAGAVLLALIVVEVVTLPSIRALLSVHVVVGVVLAGPLAVKTASTGWRFIRYYLKDPAYRRKGPPQPLLRALAPPLLLLTLVVIGSGIALVTVRDAAAIGVLDRVHKVSFLLWGMLVGVHVLAYIGRVPGLIVSDWRRARMPRVPGREQRLGVTLASLLAGAIAALLILHTMPGSLPIAG